jgi:hypothetical protein
MSKKIQTTCPQCQARLAVSAEKAGLHPTLLAANLDFLLPNELLVKLLHDENTGNSFVDIGF